MMNSEAILAKLFELRKEYNDDKEDPMYQALHHACLFISYKMSDFKAYVKQAEEQEERDGAK